MYGVKTSQLIILLMWTFFSALQDNINDYQSQGRVILCGDWNARVGNGSRPDFIPCDRVVENIDSDNYLPGSLSLRRSQDNVCNSHGLKLLDLCKSTSLRIANGRLGSDNGIGTFTFASRTGCSVTDYVILGHGDFYCMNDFKIHPFCEWSDHTPFLIILCVTMTTLYLKIRSTGLV